MLAFLVQSDILLESGIPKLECNSFRGLEAEDSSLSPIWLHSISLLFDIGCQWFIPGNGSCETVGGAIRSFNLAELGPIDNRLLINSVRTSENIVGPCCGPLHRFRFFAFDVLLMIMNLTDFSCCRFGHNI